jgi:hypothetical protein
VATGKQKHHQAASQSSRGRIPKAVTLVQRMKRKLMTRVGQTIYARRKSIVEPVFGQIKQAQGFRRFLLRGVQRVEALQGGYSIKPAGPQAIQPQMHRLPSLRPPYEQ